MARLPQVGGDSGNWGAILNDFLSQSLAADGTLNVDSVGAPQLKPNSVTNAAIAPATIAEDKLATAVQTKLNAAVSADDLDAKLDKTSTPNRVYGTNGSGAQSLYEVGTSSEGSLVTRRSGNQISVGTPTNNDDVARKDYVDTAIANLPPAPVQSVNGQTGNVTLGFNKSDVGLGNVDNTSDANKPVSTAAQAALDTKLTNPMTTPGDLIYGGVNGAPTRLASSAANNRALIVSTAGGDPAWGQIPLGTAVSGTLLVGNGGTGRTTNTTAYGIIAAGTTATGAQQTIAPGTSGYFLKSAGASSLASFAQIAQSDVQDLSTDLAAKMTGPASSVANTLPRFNGTSGKALQGSGITVDSTDHLSISTPSTLGKLTVKGENTNNEFVGLFMENGITPVNSATSSTMGRMVSVQGNGGAYFMGRDVTNTVEFIMGTSSGGSAFAGSMTSHNFDLRTGNVSKLFIQHSNGNVGVGTTSPGEKLTVSGNISSTGTINGRNVSADGVKVETYGMGTVVHGATAATTRPTGFACVTWIGSVQPTNALTNDIWIYKA